MIGRPLVEFLLSRGKIFCLVSTLFGLKTTDNLYEFQYLYPNQTFSKFPQQNCSFIFSPFLLDCCKIRTRCFKQIWAVGKVGKAGKVGREGLIMPTWNQL